MKTKDVIDHMGGMTKLCALLQCHRSSVYQWGEAVPEPRQYELEVKTGGKLKSDYTLQRKNARRRNHE
ncbi:Cro/CI family transcriptional regulator [Serratia fonticola]|uniref:Cro/CI family transcriptional regulator n=1 Tax=Serratia fonticola TaxID=47917 RepID=UPI0015C591F0|nr:Cro/CI family transcriptional regulator [Serratia fonticola]NYA15720.1 Cro/Cl family transcriptional regulator [Serratia fonticola]NYA35840.1 Cro/Cl family transcriptional regulator [Serratia fonticola]